MWRSLGIATLGLTVEVNLNTAEHGRVTRAVLYLDGIHALHMTSYWCSTDESLFSAARGKKLDTGWVWEWVGECYTRDHTSGGTTGSATSQVG